MDYNYSDYNERNIDYDSITNEDKEELYLLNIQHSADILDILADVLSYISTIESIELIYNKYDSNPKNMPNPDIPALQSLAIIMLNRIVYTRLGFIRYKHVYEKKVNGEFEFSLQPYININISNILKTIGTYYGLLALIDIYVRDGNQPIIGV